MSDVEEQYKQAEIHIVYQIHQLRKQQLEDLEVLEKIKSIKKKRSEEDGLRDVVANDGISVD